MTAKLFLFILSFSFTGECKRKRKRADLTDDSTPTLRPPPLFFVLFPPSIGGRGEGRPGKRQRDVSIEG